MKKSMVADMYANGTNPTIIKQNHGHKMSLNNYSSVRINDIIQVVRNRKYKE